MTVHDVGLGQLAEVLRRDYEIAPRGEKLTALHLFGILHAEALAGLSRATLDEIAIEAGLSPSFGTELRKMVKLARHVRAREPAEAQAGGGVSAIEQSVRPLAHDGRVERGAAASLRSFRGWMPADFEFNREEANAR